MHFSDYQIKLFLSFFRLSLSCKAFYCIVDDYVLSLLMPWEIFGNFYWSVAAILTFADSICRIMVRLLFASSGICHFLNLSTRALVKFLENCYLSNFACMLSGKWAYGKTFLHNWLSRCLPIASTVCLYALCSFLWKEEEM